MKSESISYSLCCPYCGKSGGQSVKDSRYNKKRNAVRRRRLCRSCNERWTSIDLPILDGYGTMSAPEVVSEIAALMESLERLRNLVEFNANSFGDKK